MTADALRHGPVATAIRHHRLIAVLRGVPDRTALLGLVAELADAGARAFEITFDATNAEGDLVAVRERLADRADGPFLVGAGTVLRRGELEAARRAGADFGVASVLDTLLVATAVEEGLPFIPGAFTPTEIAVAWAAGATFVKLFPASAVGPSFVRELSRQMPDAALIPAGGLNAANAGLFLEAGATAVGIGSALTGGDGAARRAMISGLGTAPEAGT